MSRVFKKIILILSQLTETDSNVENTSIDVTGGE